MHRHRAFVEWPDNFIELRPTSISVTQQKFTVSSTPGAGRRLQAITSGSSSFILIVVSRQQKQQHALTSNFRAATLASGTAGRTICRLLTCSRARKRCPTSDGKPAASATGTASRQRRLLNPRSWRWRASKTVTCRTSETQSFRYITRSRYKAEWHHCNAGRRNPDELPKFARRTLYGERWRRLLLLLAVRGARAPNRSDTPWRGIFRTYGISTCFFDVDRLCDNYADVTCKTHARLFVGSVRSSSIHALVTR